MKVFIVFIGLLLINITFIVFQGDLSRYIQIQSVLKAAAEECASGAAMYYDEEAYSRGEMVINKTEAEKYADYILRRTAEILCPEGPGNLTYDMEIIDDKTGGAADQGISPCVAVTIKLTAADLFRLSFLKMEQVIRSAKYELADY